MVDFSTLYGKHIYAASLHNNTLRLNLDNRLYYILDNGQQCCEDRYISTDDDPNDLVGHTLTKIEVKPADTQESEDGVHECAFVEITTDKGSITLRTHNVHNGCYGGFNICVLTSDEYKDAST